MTEKKSYSISDLVAQCDPYAPMPGALREWDQAAPVGRERIDISDQKPPNILCPAERRSHR